MNENENTITPKLWDSVKVVLRGSFIAMQAYPKTRGTLKNLTLHLKQVDKEEQKNLKVSRRNKS